MNTATGIALAALGIAPLAAIALRSTQRRTQLQRMRQRVRL